MIYRTLSNGKIASCESSRRSASTRSVGLSKTNIKKIEILWVFVRNRVFPGWYIRKIWLEASEPSDSTINISDTILQPVLFSQISLDGPWLVRTKIDVKEQTKTKCNYPRIEKISDFGLFYLHSCKYVCTSCVISLRRNQRKWFSMHQQKIDCLIRTDRKFLNKF